jgi:hypothetical protein
LDGGAKREISEAAQHSKPETLSFSSPIQAGLSLVVVWLEVSIPGKYELVRVWL